MSWFYDNLTRDQAVRALMHNTVNDGQFLVRQKENEMEFGLSFRYDQVKNNTITVVLVHKDIKYKDNIIKSPAFYLTFVFIQTIWSRTNNFLENFKAMSKKVFIFFIIKTGFQEILS
jgi:hypothetical protein